ncbi:MAG TPA: hypothetical protein VFO57_12870 [Burkholderiales bacterium]|nr:hypothetical protein [Burkholderiales bacterium]
MILSANTALVKAAGMLELKQPAQAGDAATAHAYYGRLPVRN